MHAEAQRFVGFGNVLERPPGLLEKAGLASRDYVGHGPVSKGKVAGRIAQHAQGPHTGLRKWARKRKGKETLEPRLGPYDSPLLPLINSVLAGTHIAAAAVQQRLVDAVAHNLVARDVDDD